MINDLKASLKKLPYQKKKIAVLLLVPGSLFFLSWNIFLSKELGEEKRLLVRADDLVKRVAVQSQLTMLQSSYAANKGFLAQSSGVDWVIEAAYKAAQASSFQVNAVAPSETIKSDIFKEVEISIEGSGTYHQIGKFFEHLENNKPGIFLKHFRFSKSGNFDPESSGRLQAYLTVTVYSEA